MSHNIPEGFVEAANAKGEKRIVPAHYIGNKALGDWRLTGRGKALSEPAEDTTVKAEEPAKRTTQNAKEAAK
ncbi:hypothetical protein [Zhihengliuella flava]|uniref:Uncharacterized protein n=1 Tax=Zhihengliuella flava TaxID=1285193 RepID=A0A931D7D8_9MICC|nr:hypothetical protein [Zhihengliuella flava]MBG6085814.1 hypothetical protein [Zhihengliuella flava]